MISVETYLLFVAPLLIGVAGLGIYWMAGRDRAGSARQGR